MADAAVAHELLIPSLPAPFQNALTAGPYNFELSPDENLRLTSFNSLVGVTIAVRGRIKRPDNTIDDISFDQIPNTDRSAKTTDFPIGQGYLLNLTLFASSGSPRISQTFVRLQIIRGRTGATTAIGTLVQGCITASQDRAWPGSPIETSTSAPAVARVIVGTDPAPGVELSETVPTGALWQLITLRVGFGASAAAGNRQSSLQFISGGNTLYQATHFATIAPTAGPALSWGQNMSYETAPNGNLLIAGLPADLLLRGGDSIVSATSGLAAGDNYGQPIYLVREWLEAQ